MKVSVKKVDAVKREMQFEIPPERVQQTMEGVYKELAKVAKVRGFRPGKAPRQVIEAEHGDVAKEETLKKIIPEVYEEALNQEKMEPLDLPEIVDVEFKDGKVKFTAKFDVKPEVKVGQYKGLAVTRKSSEVSDEEIMKTFEFLKKSQGQGAEVKIDDQFAKGLGYPTLADFKKSLTRQMEIDKDRQNRMDVENQIVEALLKDAKLAVPQSLVEKQMERRLEDLTHRLHERGMPEAEIKKKETDFRKELLPQVEKDVKTFLVLDKIRNMENVPVAENENMPAKVIEFLLKEAVWQEAKA